MRICLAMHAKTPLMKLRVPLSSARVCQQMIEREGAALSNLSAIGTVLHPERMRHSSRDIASHELLRSPEALPLGSAEGVVDWSPVVNCPVIS
ncbi:MAG: hypothetical protein SGPRY_015073 [Prymnesium sp.]